MWILFGSQIFIIVLFTLISWAILKKKAYWLLSGFAWRPAAEQQELIQNGYPQKIAKLFNVTAVGLAILLPLMFTPFKYAVEAQFGFLIVFLLSGLVFLSKYEVPKKRKRSYIITSILAIMTIGFVGGLSFLGYAKYELVTNKNTFEITGMYGDKWEYTEIQQIELLKKMPEVTWKVEGFGTASLSKGYFKVKNHGSSLLFVQKGSSPYIYIEMKSQKIFINGENSEQTSAWYEELKDKFEAR